MLIERMRSMQEVNSDADHENSGDESVAPLSMTAVVVGVLVGLVVVAVGVAAAITVGQMMLHPGTGPYPLPGPPMPDWFVWYAMVPTFSAMGAVVAIAAGSLAAKAVRLV
ncbi:hypothetical protein D2E41_26585 [Mycobacteroides abscessus]|nr:hypothetical protein D2E41_26585 [Mycobacteroides abscessus]